MCPLGLRCARCHVRTQGSTSSGCSLYGLIGWYSQIHNSRVYVISDRVFRSTTRELWGRAVSRPKISSYVMRRAKAKGGGHAARGRGTPGATKAVDDAGSVLPAVPITPGSVLPAVPITPGSVLPAVPAGSVLPAVTIAPSAPSAEVAAPTPQTELSPAPGVGGSGDTDQHEQPDNWPEQHKRMPWGVWVYLEGTDTSIMFLTHFCLTGLNICGPFLNAESAAKRKTRPVLGAAEPIKITFATNKGAGQWNAASGRVTCYTPPGAENTGKTRTPHVGNHGPLLRITSIRKPTLRRQPTRPIVRLLTPLLPPLGSRNSLWTSEPPWLPAISARGVGSQHRTGAFRSCWRTGPSWYSSKTPESREPVQPRRTSRNIWRGSHRAT